LEATVSTVYTRWREELFPGRNSPDDAISSVGLTRANPVLPVAWWGGIHVSNLLLLINLAAQFDPAQRGHFPPESKTAKRTQFVGAACPWDLEEVRTERLC